MYIGACVHICSCVLCVYVYTNLSCLSVCGTFCIYVMTQSIRIIIVYNTYRSVYVFVLPPACSS